MYAPGLIMKSGGCSTGGARCQPSAFTEYIDVSGFKVPFGDEVDGESGFVWTLGCSMHHARHFHTLTVLPDGRVLATGGNSDGNGHFESYCNDGAGFDVCSATTECTTSRCSNPGTQVTSTVDFCVTSADCEAGQECVTPGGACAAYVNESFAVKAAEIWDPGTKKWTEVASQQAPRMYHSIALLLPDGRVLSAGGGKSGPLEEQYTAEFYSPPYLFQGPRPTIMDLPESITVGVPFEVTLGSPASTQVDHVNLVRLGSVTHQFDMDQRFVPLNHQVMTSNKIRVFAPSSVNDAPPGWYMLFVLDDGVPSLGEYIQILGE